MIHTVKGFGIVNKAEIDVFLEFSSFFDDPTDVGNLISGSSAFFKSSLNIWKFVVHVLLKMSSQSYVFSSSHVWIWKLDYKETWVPKIWCFWTVVLEKTLESPWDFKEIKPVHPKGNQSWIFIERTDAEAETLILWLPDAKNWFIWKDPDSFEKTFHLKRCWERLKVGGEGDDRRWNGWMASPIRWTWVWVSSRS